ncbi:MAG TPA: RagB/SusD family nutrient uptake outer membrane protein [Saprospiraceae bacterium]|nr:RagB/SusD family nutrient uptake outer membrane protein [Saprospiraceae bacterium]HMP23140.1 RagB/SusD family nutrient uptake outer membrane protein [Saprospiraceae bacterium]
MKKIIIIAMIPLLFLLGSCEREYLNPNAATKQEVINSVEGLLAMVVGLKREYSVGATGALYNVVSANGLTTNELFVINTGNGELAALEAGFATLGNANAFLNNIWTSLNLVRVNSQLIIDNARNIPDPGTATGVVVYGHVFKALAIGTMAQFWEQVPTEVISSADFLAGRNVTFKARTAALEEAVQLLEAAAGELAKTPISSFFTSKVGADINIGNTTQALLARYYMMLGNADKALEAANRVDLSSRSVFRYETINQNPVFRTSLVNNNTYNGVHNFGLTGALAPNPADGRIPFYLGDNPLSNVRVQGFFKSDPDPIPVYLPGEVILIKAEAQARRNQLPQAIQELNRVLTKTDDIFGVNANLPAYSGPQTQEAVLQEIYRNRCIELYMTGLKLEDSRRFGRPGPTATTPERNRNFYPYPLRERTNNPNTPADPAN